MQTLHIVLGIAVALLYGGAVLAAGILLVVVIVPLPARAAVRSQRGLHSLVLAWLGFVMGQGALGMVWLVLSLMGLLYAWFVWGFCALGWLLGCSMVWIWKREGAAALQRLWSGLRSFLHSRSWYRWIGIGIGVLLVLRGVITLLPPSVADALWVYLPAVKVIAFSHTVALQPFNSPHNGLYPLQVDMHWAALFTISNETAITVWDYLCAVSFLSGVGLLAWALTSDHRVALMALLMMLSTPGVYNMIGGAKADNAAAQYGIAACLWLIFLPTLRRRAILCAGICAGWLIASRYTNVIVLPALLVFFMMIVTHPQGNALLAKVLRESKGVWVSHLLVGAFAVGAALSPMLIKNWLLVGCPLAPQFGCQETFWADIYGSPRQNLTVVDLLFYPFIWTFAHRADMLGNISPLFIGFLPFFLLIYRFSSLVRSTYVAGVAGLVSMITWWLIEPFILFTRWLLIPLALFAIPLSAALVSLEQEIRYARTSRWLIRSAVFMTMLFLLFQSRDVIYAIRYITMIDDRDSIYASEPYFDVAAWLNVHVQPGQRVALKDYGGYFYFLSADILLSSESAEELQWIWERRGHLSITEVWNFYAQRGFTYVVVRKADVNNVLSLQLKDSELQIVFIGQKKIIGRIEKSKTLREI